MVGVTLLDFIDTCSKLQMFEISWEEEWGKPKVVIKGLGDVVKKVISPKLCMRHIVFVDSYVEDERSIIRVKVISGNVEDE